MFRIEFSTYPLRSADITEAQMRANMEAGWEMLGRSDPHDRPLAIVGGGPSAAEHLDELKEWRGDIWAINQTAAWLSHHAPKANVCLFTVDPDEALAEQQFVVGVQKAILGSACHPRLFEALRGKDVRMFHCRDIDGMNLPVLGGGHCSASRAVMQAAWRGYPGITFYGCEGSIGTWTHAYRNESRKNQFVVKAGDDEFITTPDLFINTQDLVEDIREYPNALKEKSGGLLRGMLEHPDTWDVVALSSSLRDRLDPTATERYYPKAA